MKFEKGWKFSNSDQIAFAAALVAGISLIVSIRSCQQVDQTLALAKSDYEESHSFFWTGTVNDKVQLQLEPSNPEVKIQAAWLTFPKIFNMGGGDELGPGNELKSSSHFVDFQRVRDKITELIKGDIVFTNGVVRQQVSDNEEMASELHPIGIAVEMREAGPIIPLTIESSYIIKGQIRADRSLYYLPYYYTVAFGPGTNEWHVKEIDFQQLRFDRHLINEKSQVLVEELWKRP